MERFRRIGEVLGSLKALMVLQDDIQFNQRQCCLLRDIFSLAFDTIAEEIRNNLKLEEKNTKWKPLELPLKELHRIFKEAELYIRHCMDSKDWWAKLINLHHNNDCIEYHIHNLLCYFPAIIEAIENAGEISGLDQDEMQKRHLVILRKYHNEWNDPKLFHWRFGKQYLVPREICARLESAWREDRWLLMEELKEKASSGGFASKNEQRLAQSLLKMLNRSEPLSEKLPPASILVGAKDYQVRRRLGSGSQFKEIQWLGENFALRHFCGEIEPVDSEISLLLSLAHPNILKYLCGFYDEEKKECFLVMELMNKDLMSYMKENSGPRRQVLFPLPVIVDLMLQIARGMEYLHSKKIYHGDLNPTNVLMKPRNSSEGYFQTKISGFGLSSVENPPTKNSSNTQADSDPSIWYAPEVLAEQEQAGTISACKRTEKADVYSFGMICFELLTGKVPFGESHLRGEKMSYNIRTGERPLFPHPCPKYLVNLTKRCWQTDPSQRPTFTSVSRIMRYVKKFLAMGDELCQPELQVPAVDYCDLEAGFLKKFSANGVSNATSTSQIPFQMFAYRLLEKEKGCTIKDKTGDSASDAVSNCKYDCASTCRDDNASVTEDPFVPADSMSVCSDIRSVYSEAPYKKINLPKQGPGMRGIRKGPGSVDEQLPKSPRLTTRSQNTRTKMNQESLSPLPFRTGISRLSQGRRRMSGHVSDSDLH